MSSSVSTPALFPPGPNLPLELRPDLRRMSVDAAVATAAVAAAAASPSSRHLEASFSPRPETVAGDGSHPMVQRVRSKADLEEAKEARRQAAQTSLKNMESKSLAGLGAFGVSRGCKQVPIKMMGWSKG